MVTLFWGPRTMLLLNANRDTVNENFGPFDVGPCYDGGGCWGAGLFENMLKKTFDFRSGCIELGLRCAVMHGDDKVILFREPCGREFNVHMTNAVKSYIQLTCQVQQSQVIGSGASEFQHEAWPEFECGFRGISGRECRGRPFALGASSASRRGSLCKGGLCPVDLGLEISYCLGQCLNGAP